MNPNSPLWQTVVMLIVLAASIIGLVLHFVPSLKGRIRNGLGNLLSQTYMPKAAQQYAARHLVVKQSSACGCCSGCSSSPPPTATISLHPRRGGEVPPARPDAKPAP
ncbi:DUF6587 family protein [Bordetella genomosp. 4]|uniref:Uncharacterized protein n=1 Tax=Bordetella genomosp. 4 TaxID=463044 RepID=A0A261UX41_9BORD|nr:DUF6587 family protein [Bordetella genomosp. 4]OZI66161.1 hypothetical protein CAL20_02290 [Bordetella genomosp. 4]